MHKHADIANLSNSIAQIKGPPIGYKKRGQLMTNDEIKTACNMDWKAAYDAEVVQKWRN